MSWIDVAIASLVVVAALRGWSQGLLRQIGALLGRALGLVGGAYVAASVAPRISAVGWRPLDVVLIIVFATVLGGLAMRFAGGVFSNRLREHHLGLVDSLAGASVGAVGTLLACWFVAALLAVVPWGSLSQSINRSVVLREVGRVLPAPPAIAGRIQGILGQLNVPSLFARVVAPTLPGVAHGVFTTRHHVSGPGAVVAVAASGDCRLSAFATGVVVAPGEVVTVAHALAGQRSVVVDGHRGRVVLFDPRWDVALVRVGGLSAPALNWGAGLARGTRATLVGYVNAGDRVASSAVSLGAVSGPGRDIYSGPVFTRTMDVVATTMSPGESGAPLVVSGAFAALADTRAVFDTSLVYAVPVARVRAELARAGARTVSTGRCVN